MEIYGQDLKSEWIIRLYEEESARLLLYGKALGLSEPEAEDILQETFIALIKLDIPPSQPMNYCLKSYRNRALNLKRNIWRRIKSEIESIIYYKTNTDDNWFYPASSEDDDYNISEIVTEALKSIPLKQREVIVLKIWHNLTFEEIGGILGISPNTAAGRYRYGLAKLKKILQAYEKEYYQSAEHRNDIKRTSTALTIVKG
jgi:RNA polymerase sigma-70 factor (ECF subfamily)